MTTGCGLALAVLGVVVRFIIRFRVQKQRVEVDDVLIILALGLLIANSAVMYSETSVASSSYRHCRKGLPLKFRI